MNFANVKKIASGRALRRIASGCGCALALLAGATLAAAEPTPEQIASDWAAFSGGLSGLVVYNNNDTLWLLDLQTGLSKSLKKFAQASFSYSDDWGQSSGYRISPDGTRIAAQNGSGVFVCDITGQNTKIIWQGAPAGDQIALCWDGNDKVVYSQGWKIASTQIQGDNSAGATEILWDHAQQQLPGEVADIGGRGLVSVNKCGDYLSFDILGSKCANVPILVKLSTMDVVAPIGCQDGCQVRMLMDSTGTISFHEMTHNVPATMYQWGEGILSQTVSLPSKAMGECGVAGFGWTYDKKFMIQTGDNDLNNSPGCIKTARIRKAANLDQMMYLGTRYYWPDLWVGPPPSAARFGQGKPASRRTEARILVHQSRGEVIVRSRYGQEINDVQLYNLHGMAVARPERTSVSAYRIEVEGLPSAAYLLSWQQDGRTLCRYVNVRR
jgi:hypothetical protein